MPEPELGAWLGGGVLGSGGMLGSGGVPEAAGLLESATLLGGGGIGRGVLVASEGVPLPSKVLVFSGVAVADEMSEGAGGVSESLLTSNKASEIEPGFGSALVDGGVAIGGA